MGSRIGTRSEEAEEVSMRYKAGEPAIFSAEDKIWLVIAGLRGEDNVAELCRNEASNQNLYYG